MKRVHMCIIGVVLALLVAMFFFRRKKETYSSDASLILGGETIKNKTFKAGEDFTINFTEMVKYQILYELDITPSNDFTGTFSLVISNDKGTSKLIGKNVSDIKRILPGGAKYGTRSGSETSNTTASLQIIVTTGTLKIGYLNVIADGPVKGGKRLSGSGEAVSNVAVNGKTYTLEDLSSALTQTKLEDVDRKTIMNEMSSEKPNINTLIPIYNKLSPGEQTIVGPVIKQLYNVKMTSLSQSNPTTKPPSSGGIQNPKTTVTATGQYSSGKAESVSELKPGSSVSIINEPGIYSCRYEGKGFFCERVANK